MPNEVRKKLLADYAVALVAERESWGRLHEPDLTEAERCRVLGEWKQIAAALKILARQLREAPVASRPVASQTFQWSGAPSLLPADLVNEWETEAAAAPAPTASRATALRRPFYVHCLAASLRLTTACRARLQTLVPRPGSP